MFALIRTAIRFFLIGFAAGVLFAPRAGAETRKLLSDKLNEMLDFVLEVADLPRVEAAGSSGAGRRHRRGETQRHEQARAGSTES